MGNTKTDHTAAIFTALGVTPEGMPWAYCVSPIHKTPCPHTLLLSGTIEADGLAVRMVGIALDRYLIKPPTKKYRGDWIIFSYSRFNWECTITQPSFAHAVHDALVEALGITGEDTP
jgi:hypothetical protein